MMMSGVQATFGCPFLYLIHLSITGHSSLLEKRAVCTHVLESTHIEGRTVKRQASGLARAQLHLCE